MCVIGLRFLKYVDLYHCKQISYIIFFSVAMILNQFYRVFEMIEPIFASDKDDYYYGISFIYFNTIICLQGFTMILIVKTIMS